MTMLYYAILLTFGGTGAFRMTENSRGEAFIRVVQILVQAPPGVRPVKKP